MLHADLPVFEEFASLGSQLHALGAFRRGVRLLHHLDMLAPEISRGVRGGVLWCHFFYLYNKETSLFLMLDKTSDTFTCVELRKLWEMS